VNGAQPGHEFPAFCYAIGLHVDFASAAFACSVAVVPVAMNNLAAVGGLIIMGGTSTENDSI
jgi:hypothetical protein